MAAKTERLNLILKLLGALNAEQIKSIKQTIDKTLTKRRVA